MVERREYFSIAGSPAGSSPPAKTSPPTVTTVMLGFPTARWEIGFKISYLQCTGFSYEDFFFFLMTSILFSTTNKLQQASAHIASTTSPTMQVCDYGDFVDGQCSTTTVTSPATETTTTALAEDFGMHFVCGDLRT